MRYNEVMFIAGLLSWWYGQGWRRQFLALSERLAGLMDYFSLDLLVKTLFAPFRQISAGHVDGPLGVKLRAFFDRLVSRMIGAAVRLVMLVVGSLAIILYAVVGLVVVLLWVVIPALPIVGLVLAITGWMPWAK